MIMKRFLISILLVFSLLNIHAQNVYIRAVLDTGHILIGDQVKLRLEAEYPNGVKAILPQLKDTVSTGIEIVSLFKTDSAKAGDKFRYAKTYIVTSFDSGQYFVPALPFVFTYPDGRKDTLMSYPVELLVTNQLNDTTKVPYDIKKPLSVPITLKEYLTWTGIGLLIAAVIGFVYFLFWMRKRNKPLFRFEKPKDPAYVIAIRELDTVKAEKLWQQGKTKEYYTKLTDILRLYIEDYFNVPALESTTDEIIESVSELKLIDSSKIVSLKDMLQSADLVKFAKSSPLPDENDKAWDTSYEFVMQTKNLLQSTIVEKPKAEEEAK